MNLFTSLMRTLTPIVAGLVLGLAARFGFGLDDATVTMYVAAGLIAGYYALWRVLEYLAERIGWQPLQTLTGLLLGWARPPQYVEPVTAPLRLRLDKAAMDRDMDEFVRKLGNALDGGEDRR
jgi:hypothetical protein